MTGPQEHVDITLDIDKGITPHELAEMLAEQGLKPLLHHASSMDLGRSIMTPKFEDGVDQGLVEMLEKYYASFLSDAELGNALAKIRLRLFDWTQVRGVEVAEVDLKNLAEDGHTHLHQPDEFQDQSNQPRLVVFMPPKILGPNVALHHPFGEGKIEFTPNRTTNGDILGKTLRPPTSLDVIKNTGQTLYKGMQRIQYPGETTLLYAPVHQIDHRPPRYDFGKLDRSKMQYHQVLDLHPSASPTAIFARRLKEE